MADFFTQLYRGINPFVDDKGKVSFMGAGNTPAPQTPNLSIDQDMAGIRDRLNKAFDAGSENVRGFYTGSLNKGIADTNVGLSKIGLLGSPAAMALQDKMRNQNANTTANTLKGLESDREKTLANTDMGALGLSKNMELQKYNIDTNKYYADQQALGGMFSGIGQLIGTGIGTAKDMFKSGATAGAA